MGNQGGPCDKKCVMCYYAYQKDLVFYSLETMMQHANLFRHYYGVDAVDISGGEPTIFKGIVPLVEHCANIGLKPTLITHGQNNGNGWQPWNLKRPLYAEIEDAGLEDWLISLHGADAKAHDAVLSQEGSFDRLIDGLHNIKRPARFNTTIQKDNYKNLPVNVLKDRPPTVWNPIMFNPFFYWADKSKTEIDFQVSYTDAAPYLASAIAELEALGWEVNVRYWPLCIAEKYGFAANVCGYHQVPFDPWEWRLNVTQRTPMESIEEAGGWHEAERQLAGKMMASRDNEKCSGCSLTAICDKPPEQYQNKYGTDELTTVTGESVTDPLHFLKERAVV